MSRKVICKECGSTHEDRKSKTKYIVTHAMMYGYPEWDLSMDISKSGEYESSHPIDWYRQISFEKGRICIYTYNEELIKMIPFDEFVDWVEEYKEKDE